MLEILSLPTKEAGDKISSLTKEELTTLWEQFYSSRPLRKRNLFCIKCHNCVDCHYCYNCLNCTRCDKCAFCDDVVDGHWVVFNVQLTEKQWSKCIRNINKLRKEYKASIED